MQLGMLAGSPLGRAAVTTEDGLPPQHTQPEEFHPLINRRRRGGTGRWSPLLGHF